MLVKAYAKINISLDVVGKREDGYHLLKMIMQNIDIYDVLKFNIINKSSKDIVLNCNKNYVPTDERNLAFKAARLFIENFDIDKGVEIYLKKNIPVAAGLAGGSTDAAAVLIGLNRLFEVGASTEELMRLGLKIGADVPYCIVGGTALCEGIGEIVTPLKPFKNHILVVVKPGFGVSTKEVYQKLDIEKIFKHPDTDGIIQAMNSENLNGVCESMKNILENVTLRKHYLLKTIKKEMMEAGALGAMMSGSGPTIFAFFSDMLTAQRCFEKMKQKYDEVFITRTV